MKHTLCTVFCCKMYCRDGRTALAVTFGDGPPVNGLKMQFVGPWMRQNNGNGYKVNT